MQVEVVLVVRTELACKFVQGGSGTEGMLEGNAVAVDDRAVWWQLLAVGTLLAKSDLIRDDDGAPPPAATDVSGGSESPNDYQNRNNVLLLCLCVCVRAFFYI